MILSDSAQQWFRSAMEKAATTIGKSSLSPHEKRIISSKLEAARTAGNGMGKRIERLERRSAKLAAELGRNAAQRGKFSSAKLLMEELVDARQIRDESRRILERGVWRCAMEICPASHAGSRETSAMLAIIYGERMLAGLLPELEVPSEIKGRIVVNMEEWPHWENESGARHKLNSLNDSYKLFLESGIRAGWNPKAARKYADIFIAIMNVSEGIYGKPSHGYWSAVVAMPLLRKIKGLDAKSAYSTQIGILVHDIGKACIHHSILAKDGPLNEREYEVLKGHSKYGALLAKAVFRHNGEREGRRMEQVLNPIIFHHHRYDGERNPETAGHKIAGDQIPLGGRIAAITDTFDAMADARPYSPSKSAKEIREEIIRCANKQFDPVLAWEFAKIIDEMVERARR